jgi:hypothetical protein
LCFFFRGGNETSEEKNRREEASVKGKDAGCLLLSARRCCACRPVPMEVWRARARDPTDGTVGERERKVSPSRQPAQRPPPPALLFLTAPSLPGRLSPPKKLQTTRQVLRINFIVRCRPKAPAAATSGALSIFSPRREKRERGGESRSRAGDAFAKRGNVGAIGVASNDVFLYLYDGMCCVFAGRSVGC